MIYVNVKTVLDTALSKFMGQPQILRDKGLIWFREIVKDILGQPREWAFLYTETTLTVVNDTITLPDDFGELINLQVNDKFFTIDDQLSDEDIFDLSEETDSVPYGFQLKAGDTITFIPGATDTCVVKYEKKSNATYLDTLADTIFPIELENLFVTGVRMHAYDYEKDGRYSKEVTLYQYEMTKVKSWDNKLKPVPKYTKSGFIKC